MTISLKTKIGLAFAAAYVIWGSTYLAIRIGLESMPPFLMAGIRFVVAGVLLWIWCEFRHEPRPTATQTRNAIVIGLMLVTLGNGLVTFAEQSVPSGIAALIVAVGPVFTALLRWRSDARNRPSYSTVAGLALGLSGVGLLVSGSAEGRVDPLGAALIVSATLCWTWGVLYAQSADVPSSALRSNAVQMLIGGAFMLCFGLATGEAGRFHPGKISGESLLALGYLIVFGSIVAYSAYGWLIRHVTATAAGTTAYVNPAIAVILGGLWGETIGPKAIAAMATIFLGVWLLKREKREAPTFLEAEA